MRIVLKCSLQGPCKQCANNGVGGVPEKAKAAKQAGATVLHGAAGDLEDRDISCYPYD